MRYRPLGRTGIRVSPFALGAMMFSSFGNGDQTEVDRMVARALDAGVNFIDTADAYGESEEMLGKALKGRRDDVVLASKFARPIGDDPNHQGGSRRWITTAVENSLRRLNTDHLDLYQMHRPDPETDIEETLSALTDLVRSGKVRAIGSSDSPHPTWSKPSGSPNDGGWNASAPSSRTTRSWIGRSNGRCSPSRSATAWER